MFVTAPENAFKVHVQLGPPGAMYWRMITMSTGAAWFVLTVHSVKDGFGDTHLLVCDQDLVDTIGRLDCVVESLLCIAPATQGSDDGMVCIEIGEIWQARRTGEYGDENCLVFVDRDGREREGMFLEVVSDALRGELIVKIPEKSKTSVRP